MSIEGHLSGGLSGYSVDATSNNALRVTVVPTPGKDIIKGDIQAVRTYIGLLTDSSGSSDMAVDGSSTAVEFKASASTTEIRWISELRLVFNSTSMNIDNIESRRFGAAAAAPGLTNGLLLQSCQGGVCIDIFVSPVQTIADFERYVSTASRGIVCRVDAVAAGTDFFMATIAFQEPVGLYPRTDDYISITVQDDLSAIDLFESQVAGWRQIL